MPTLLTCLGRGIFQLRRQPADDSLASAPRARALFTSSHSPEALAGWQAERSGDLHAAVFAYQRSILQSGPQWATDRLISTLAATGRFRAAADLLESAPAPSTFDALQLAALLTAAGEVSSACLQYESAARDLLHPDSDSPNAIQSATDRGLCFLQDADYDNATAAFDQAARLVDLLLCSHVGWAASDFRLRAQTQPSLHLTRSMVTLLDLEAAILRHRARALLASNFANMLRDRALRDDLAVAAMGAPQVASLLAGQRAALAALAPRHPNHAELHHRLGVLAHATGDLPTAITAWTRVLAILPSHAPTAARLAATLAATGQPDRAMDLLLSATAPCPNLLSSCHRLAITAANPDSIQQTFDRGIGVPPMVPTDLRANIAYLLAAMGLSDPQSQAWRNPFVTHPV